ncbi:RNA polymerase sigma factor [Arachidicoccus sp.]|jgi:RNA polymerase sigma-70 factor (ECF subfamily)|uniref:RNA polymerase sigma factor n=1 Tax=Arachidicoccus sp. TaxID=1872624 RepID=UPI003D228813
MNCIRELKNSNPNTFNEIYNAFHPRLYNYILHRTKSTYFAEEVVQLTFIKLWNSRSHLSDEIDLQIQIFRIAKTTLIDYIRKTQQQNSRILSAKSEGFETLQHMHRNVFYKETISKLENLIASLPPVRRKVFEMSRYKQMSHKEISEKLNITPKTVENHINLALKYIKTFFLLYLLFISLGL